MTDWTEQQLAVLRPLWPGWDLWVVRVLVPPSVVWCARPVGTPIATINAHSPEELVAEMRRQATQINTE